MKHDVIIDSLPIYEVSDSAKLGYQEKETWMKLDWNESPKNASRSVIDAVTTFLENHSLAYYPDVTSRGLIDAIAERYEVPGACISVFNGSDNALQHIFYTFLSEGSVFATLQPTYKQILQFVSFKRASIRYFRPDDVLRIDLDQFEKEGVAGADLVYLINPHNPTGHLLTREYLSGIAAKNPNTLFVLDEAYMEFASTDQSCVSLVQAQKNIIVTRTFSKAYGLAGIRLGFAVSHRENIQLIERIKNSKDINTLAQIAGEAAIRDTDYLDEHVAAIRKTREWFLGNVPANYTVYPSEANFVLVDYRNDPLLIDRLHAQKVLVRDQTTQHGLRDFLRITIGTQEQMERVLDVMRESQALGSNAALVAAEHDTATA